jgi:CubicO group peptidase (beta-lactamase class C family)
MLTKALLIITLFAGPLAAQADAPLQTFLDQTLTAARDEAHLPAVAALIQIEGKIAAEAALGVRALGRSEGVTTADRWHIGSDTKAFTSTMIARLVEKQVMRFDDTLAASFPAFAEDMNPVYRGVTIIQLLSHTAGLPPLTDDKDLPQFMAVIASVRDVKAQRAAIAHAYLTMPPASKTGEFEYSNLGFIIAGAIAEARTGKPWEDLIREQIFAPLGIRNAGFGLPGTSDKFDQPRGHREIESKLTPLDPADPQSDNPPALGPAGTINIALKDWMLFAQDQLDGAHGHGKLLKAETYRKLQTPETGNYALGWGAKLEPDGTPLLLTHTGSNGYWLADIRIMPKHDIVILLAVNAGNDAASEAVREIRKSLIARLKPFE